MNTSPSFCRSSTPAIKSSQQSMWTAPTYKIDKNKAHRASVHITLAGFYNHRLSTIFEVSKTLKNNFLFSDALSLHH